MLQFRIVENIVNTVIHFPALSLSLTVAWQNQEFKAIAPINSFCNSVYLCTFDCRT